MSEPAPVSLPPDRSLIDRRVVAVSAFAVGLGLAAGVLARVLVGLIALVTNLSFFGRFSTAHVSPADHHLGPWVVAVPVLGGIVVGLMARFGSQAIRGHGIPEAMEQVLLNKSRIPARMTILKPLSAAIAIGTGGPFGAEGPIIASGGALGSLVGQLLPATANERKTLLAAGAAAGMAATFGAPVSAVLLAVELLLFELRPRSIIPVALASAAGAASRMALVGGAPFFSMPAVGVTTGAALSGYVLIGALMGFAAIGATRLVYAVEDAFERLPVHWMWWPAIGAVAVGVAGLLDPRVLGVGYDNIDGILSGGIVAGALAALCVAKLLAWAIALGSGTSGGTLAPLFTIGGALGALAGAGLAWLVPSAGIDPRVAALVGMAAIFAGASRALLASIVFAFEATLQPLSLVPLLGACAASYFVSSVLMRTTIMTEKIVRRGVRVPAEYEADYLAHISVAEACTRRVIALQEDETVAATRRWIDSGVADSHHQGFPVVDASGSLVGLATRRRIYDPGVSPEAALRHLMRAPSPAIHDDRSLRDAADHMVREKVGRLPVVAREDPRRMVGILTRGDLLRAHTARLDDLERAERHLELTIVGRRTPSASAPTRGASRS